MKKVKLLSLFSGIGAFEKALDKLGVGYDLVNYCEIDKYASKVYAMIHDCEENKNLGDITKVKTSELPNDIDIVTYGFPCQDISIAGKQKGFGENGERTRSGLFFEALRIIEDKKPKVAICENVKNLTSKKFAKEFDIVLSSLEEAGYKNYWKVLNAKDYGVPQNRERVFIVSIRKDIDNGLFDFPEKFKLARRLKDLLVEEVDEKYYLSDEQMRKILYSPYIQEIDTCTSGDRMAKILTGIDKSCNNAKLIEIANCITTREDRGISNRKGEGTAVLAREATKKGYTEAFKYDSNSKTRRGRVGKQVAQTLTTSCNQGVVVEDCKKARIMQVMNIYGKGNPQAGRVYQPEGIAPTLDTCTGGNRMPKILEATDNYVYRIRKLIPLECFRLMGFEVKDFEKINGISDSQLYKMAGNSIAVDVLEYIFEEIFKVVDFENGKKKIRKIERLIIKIEEGYQLAFNF